MHVCVGFLWGGLLECAFPLNHLPSMLWICVSSEIPSIWYRAAYFSKRLMFGIATNTKETLKGWEKTKDSKKPQKTKNPKKPKSWEKCCAQGFPPGDCFFCFFWFLDSEVFIGYRAEKKQNHSKKAKKTKETKKTKVWGEMCPRVSSRGLFFLVSLVFLVSLFFLFFFEFFWFLDSEAFMGYRAEKKQKNSKKTKKTKETKKTKVLGEMLCPRVSSRGLFFLFFLVFFAFFLVFRLGSFHRLQGWEKTKSLEENQKNQRNHKNQSLGRNVPKGFLQGIVFFGFFGFFGFLRVFLVFDLWICVAYVRHNNQNQHFWLLQQLKEPFLGGTKTKATISTQRVLCEQQNPQ